MNDIMMQLGGFQFGVSTAAYQELSRAAEYRWAAQDRFGQRPALQYTGLGAETITLTGVIFPEYRGGTEQVKIMRDVAQRAEPLLLVDGLGGVHGRWVIERVDEMQTVFGAGGSPRKQEFTLALRKFDDGSGL